MRKQPGTVRRFIVKEFFDRGESAVEMRRIRFCIGEVFATLLASPSELITAAAYARKLRKVPFSNIRTAAASAISVSSLRFSNLLADDHTASFWRFSRRRIFAVRRRDTDKLRGRATTGAGAAGSSREDSGCSHLYGAHHPGLFFIARLTCDTPVDPHFQ